MRLETKLAPGSAGGGGAAGQTYCDAVLRLPGLVGYWRLNDANAVAAALGAAPDGSYNGGYTQAQAGATTDQDNAASFNGSTGYVLVPQSANDPGLSVGDVFTVSAFVKPSLLGAGVYQCIISGNRQDFTGNARFYLRVNPDGTLELDKYATAGIVVSTEAVDTSRFWHVLVTKNGAAVKLYLDGVDVTGPVTDATLGSVSGTPWTIGCSRDGASGGSLGDFFHGALDEVFVLNRALTAAQVSSLYAAR